MFLADVPEEISSGCYHLNVLELRSCRAAILLIAPTRANSTKVFANLVPTVTLVRSTTDTLTYAERGRTVEIEVSLMKHMAVVLLFMGMAVAQSAPKD